MTGFMLHGLGDCTEAHHCGCLATPAPSVDHTYTIAEAARECVRCLLAWASDGGKYPYAEWNALIAAVEAERADKENTP